MIKTSMVYWNLGGRNDGVDRLYGKSANQSRFARSKTTRENGKKIGRAETGSKRREEHWLRLVEDVNTVET